MGNGGERGGHSGRRRGANGGLCASSWLWAGVGWVCTLPRNSVREVPAGYTDWLSVTSQSTLTVGTLDCFGAQPASKSREKNSRKQRCSNTWKQRPDVLDTDTDTNTARHHDTARRRLAIPQHARLVAATREDRSSLSCTVGRDGRRQTSTRACRVPGAPRPREGPPSMDWIAAS